MSVSRVVIPVPSEPDALRGLLTHALGPVSGTLVWLVVRLVSAALYPWAWAWSWASHWRHHADRGRFAAWCGIVAASGLLATGVALARHSETPTLIAHAASSGAVHAADSCAGGHRSPQRC
jgi:hypothetical protein